jgi:hypothetical protein
MHQNTGGDPEPDMPAQKQRQQANNHTYGINSYSVLNSASRHRRVNLQCVLQIVLYLR